jgi:hypothetical protein
MKRFTETEKWRDAWFRGLSLDAKLVFWYLTENCDSAGVWEPDFEMVNFTFKRDIPWDEVKFELSQSVNGRDPRLRVLPSGKWLLTRFVFFQYGRLRPECIPHRSILKTIEKHGLTEDELYPTTTLAKGYEIDRSDGVNSKGSPRVCHTLQDKDKDQDKDRKGGAGGKPRDPVIDALASVDGSNPLQIPPTVWRGIGKCLADLKAMGPITADEIFRRRDNYRLHFPDIGPPSPHALVKHWARCDNKPQNGSTAKTAPVIDRVPEGFEIGRNGLLQRKQPIGTPVTANHVVV